MSLRQGYVVDTHPEDNSVDLVMVDDGTRMVGVQILTVDGSTRSGATGIPKVLPKGDKWNITQATGQDQIAIVGFVRGHPVVVGFLLPQINQITFADKDRSIRRHTSDVYATVTGTGDVEFYHPSGAYIRIAEAIEHEDLTNKNFDKSFVIDRNKSRQPHIFVSTKDGTCKLDMAPDGTVTVTAAVKVVLKTPRVEVPDGDVIVSGISFLNHVHGGVVSGGGTSGPPEP